MHMADALVSPAVGSTMWVATAGLTLYSARKSKTELDDGRVPLMGVLGAFVFAAQMINFSIPGTGSSGHLGGGMILAILLGPHAAFLTMASILTVQALFFADGGLLALGCNIFNLGFFPCFVAYPLIYRKIVGENRTHGRVVAGSLAASIVGLQMGALAVVFETLLSGISELPFSTFLLMMQPIHLAIGVVEGLVTAAVLGFLLKARPDLLELGAISARSPSHSLRNVIAGFFVIALIAGGVLSWFASSNPDGLEWSMFRTAGKEELRAPRSVFHEFLASIQRRTAIFPDYKFKGREEDEQAQPGEKAGEVEPEKEESWPAVSGGTSVSGIVGGLITMVLVGMIGLGLRRLHNRT